MLDNRLCLLSVNLRALVAQSESEIPVVANLTDGESSPPSISEFHFTVLTVFASVFALLSAHFKVDGASRRVDGENHYIYYTINSKIYIKFRKSRRRM